MNLFNFTPPRCVSEWSYKRRYSLFIVLLIGFTALCCYAVHYRIKPNHIIETVLFFVLIHRFSPKVCKFLLTLSAVLISLYYPIGQKYGEISTAAIFSVAYTNTAEAKEFLQALNPITVSVGLFLGAIIFLFSRWAYRLPQPSFSKRLSAVLGLIIVGAVVETAHPDRNPIRIMPFQVIFDSAYAVWLFNQDFGFSDSTQDTDWWKIQSIQQPYKNYVLIQGESASPAYMSTYGFPISSTPFSDSHANIIMGKVFSAGPNTPISLQYNLFARQNDKTPMSANIINLANTANMKTYWLSNQHRTGRHETAGTVLAYTAHQSQFMHEQGKSIDTDLLPFLEQAVTEPIKQNKLIVLHLMGSHTDACARLTTPVPNYTHHAYQNCYIASIYQTDKLIESVYHILEKQGEPFSILYMSDHGQGKLYGGILKHSDDFTIEHTDQQLEGYHIPFFIINSDKQGTSPQHNCTPRSGFHIINGLTQWLGITTENLPHNYDFFGNLPDNDIQAFDMKYRLATISQLKDEQGKTLQQRECIFYPEKSPQSFRQPEK